MRTLPAVLLAKFSICGATSSAPASSPTVVLPKLRENLSVSLQPAGTGEPVALVGGEDMLCAVRKDAPSACIGEIGLVLEAVDADDGRYARNHTERPVAIERFNLGKLSASGYSRCVLVTGGTVDCWRRHAGRQREYPEQLSFKGVRTVAAADQTCVIVESGDVLCTGDEVCGGRESTPGYDLSQIVKIPGVDKARLIKKALHMGCVVREDSTVACWGKTLENAVCSPEAVVVPGLEDVVDIAVGNYSACAVRADNRVFCWGNNSGQSFGVPEPEHSVTPIEVPGTHPAVRIESVSRGFAVLRVDGSMVAWGSELLMDEKDPPKRLELAGPAVDFVVLSGMVCALLDTGDVQCEGYSVDFAVQEKRPRPPFEGKAPWVEAPLYRLAPRPAE